MTVEQILAWADQHKAATNDWPNQYSGQVAGTDETWAGINAALNRGQRGISGGSSLAKLLAEHCGYRNTGDLPSLTIQQILTWADEHRAATGDWPRRASGAVPNTDETWAGIANALRAGTRGPQAGSSLARLLAEHRGVRNIQDLPTLTIKQILAWVDAHKVATGDWPNQKSGQVTGTDETWAGINNALLTGTRGPQAGSSLAKLLAEHRGVRNIGNTPPLTVEQILAWADDHEAATGDWPNLKSGQVTGTDETWAGIDAALSRGNRGLPGESTLAKLLAEHRGVRNIHDLPPLSIQQILVWADEHRAVTGDWPRQASGRVSNTDETWTGINTALNRGRRGLPSGSSLPRLLTEHRGVKNHKDLPLLTLKQVLTWVDEHKTATGDWPEKTSGRVRGTDETWAGIDTSLSRGKRGFLGESTLAKLLAEHRGVRNKQDLPPLTHQQILTWVDEHKAATGDWPEKTSGQVSGTDETWSKINSALYEGSRGLPGGSTLAKLLAEQRSVRNLKDLPPLTIKQILEWVDAHKAATGEWPNQKSGQVTETDETWAGIDNSLRKGRRGLESGSSIAKLLEQRRSHSAS